MPAGAANASISSAAKPPGCSVFTADGKSYVMSFNADRSSATKCGAGGAAKPRLVGAATSVITFEADIDAATDTAKLTLTGPSAVWFGVGLGAVQVTEDPQ